MITYFTPYWVLAIVFHGIVSALTHCFRVR